MNTKIMFSKIASVMTIFMMVFSMVGPMNARAQEETTEPTIEPTPEVTSVLGCMDSSATNFNADATEDDGSCEYEKQEEIPELSRIQIPQEAQISAYKVLCPSEDLLPNWGDGDGSNITSSTASDFVAENPSCEIVPWIFEWIADGEGDENMSGDESLDNEESLEDDGWTTFANTVMVPANQTVWVREQLPEGYQTFSGTTSNPADEEVSAEFYCDTDVLNYDNFDYIHLNAGHDGPYHCVGFNAHPDMCENIEGIQVEVPKGMEADGDYCYTPQQEEGGMCEGDEETYSNVYVSDTNTGVEDDGPATAEILSFIHGAWTAVISDASWIWSTDPVVTIADPAYEVETFIEEFEVEGTPTGATLEIAADNTYSVTLNGDAICGDVSITDVNFTSDSQDICVIPAEDLIVGDNVLEITVTNLDHGNNAQGNPAGLMYKLTVNGDCETCELTNGWAVDYYNYDKTDVGMNLNPTDWNDDYGNPLSLDNTFSADSDTWTGWSYGVDKYKFSQVESDLMFGTNFFPFDGGAYENKEGDAHDYHFGLKATAYVNAPSAGNYGYELSSDDDVWVYVDGVLVLDNDGVHPASLTTGNIPLDEGINKVELYFAERHIVASQLDFRFTDEELTFTTDDDCLPPPPMECPEGWTGIYPSCYPPIEVIDLCLNLPGTQTEVPEGFENVGEGMCYSDYECSDGIDNSDSEDELSDASDPACHTDGDATDEDEVDSYDPYDMSEENTTEEVCEWNQEILASDENCQEPENDEDNSNRSSGSRSGSRSGGSVLGASTDLCAWNASFMRRGWHGNKMEDVKTVQNFLNQYMLSNLIVDGIFGLKTEAAVKAFQAKYADDILKPWGINAPTGLFYLSTLTKAKEITCAVDENLPTLINWSANPTVR